jgi:hypothetical protein
VSGVPVIEQAENYCGPASLAALLRWSGVEVTQEQLGPLLYTPERQGTFVVDLTREVRSHGRLAYPVGSGLEGLLAEVAGGHPVLVLENRGLAVHPVWHYSVLVGFDLGEGRVVLHEGAAVPRTKSLKTFARTWIRGGANGLLALPPGTLPVARDPQGVLSALADLEEVGQLEAAAAGYEAYLRRWPGEWRGAFGWANVLHARGDAAGARKALQQAHSIAPERPEPLNNLALLAWERGAGEDARALAKQAVEKARAMEMDLESYADTLRMVTPRPDAP